MHGIDLLVAAIRAKGNPICVGLDPRLAQIPSALDRSDPATAFRKFCCEIIDAVADLVPAVKPQIAFFEEYGVAGMRAFSEVIRYARSKKLFVIADAKRGDIGSTSEAYARAYFEPGSDFECDALTINTYFGSDAVKPFEKYFAHGKAVFTQVKNSNPSSSELQDLLIDDKTVYEMMGALVEKWGETSRGESGFSSVGAVVGATFPEQGERLRAQMPHTFFLVPGYGAQGGRAEDLKKYANAKGEGMLVNSSRGIIFAYEKMPEFGAEKFAAAARKATETMIGEIGSR